MKNHHHWRGLESDHQKPRYLAIAAMCRGRVLDVGCGAGLLSSYVPDWTGIEPQGEAARRLAGVCICSAESFEANGRKWETIVFNESLYYCRHPLRVLRKYRALLSPGGAVIVSIYQRPETSWRRWVRRSNVDVSDLVDLWAMTQGSNVTRKDVPQADTFPWRIWKIQFAE